MVIRSQIVEWFDANKKLPDMQKLIDIVSDKEIYVFYQSPYVLVLADGEYDIAYCSVENGETEWVCNYLNNKKVTHWAYIPKRFEGWEDDEDDGH